MNCNEIGDHRLEIGSFSAEEILKNTRVKVSLDELLKCLEIPLTNSNRLILKRKLQFNKNVRHSYAVTEQGNINMYNWIGSNFSKT